MAETDELIAVHKPASIPVHVSGQYRKNTVMALLQVERPDLGKLFPVHRLDKPVSGLLLIAKSATAANDVRTQMMVRSRNTLLPKHTPSQYCWGAWLNHKMMTKLSPLSMNAISCFVCVWVQAICHGESA